VAAQYGWVEPGFLIVKGLSQARRRCLLETVLLDCLLVDLSDASRSAGCMEQAIKYQLDQAAIRISATYFYPWFGHTVGLAT
jgi:hypothetical protein